MFLPVNFPFFLLAEVQDTQWHQKSQLLEVPIFKITDASSNYYGRVFLIQDNGTNTLALVPSAVPKDFNRIVNHFSTFIPIGTTVEIYAAQTPRNLFGLDNKSTVIGHLWITPMMKAAGMVLICCIFGIPTFMDSKLFSLAQGTNPLHTLAVTILSQGLKAKSGILPED